MCPHFVKEIIEGTWSLLVGMAVTVRNLLSKAVTVQYPEQRLVLPERARVPIRLLCDEGKGAFKCTGCGVCAKACPAGVIKVTSKVSEDKKRTVDVYEVDLTNCAFCNMCVEACPFGALTAGKEYELATSNKEDLKGLLTDRAKKLCPSA
jgi:NADH-quinone oxidoreductase subunit I